MRLPQIVVYEKDGRLKLQLAALAEERVELGKPATGQIKLSAFHEGGYIVIRISDNGRGLNTARIREKPRQHPSRPSRI